jgi:hypothetical protein
MLSLKVLVKDYIVPSRQKAGSKADRALGGGDSAKGIIAVGFQQI